MTRLAPLAAALALLSANAVAQSGPGSTWPSLRLSIALSGSPVDSRLAEASGAALSAANPGVIWTIGDSGNPPDLLAIDSSGALLARAALVGVTNTDWEAVSVGPCGGQTCVYIADTGDNAERRREVSIHRFPEPRLGGDSRLTIRNPETLHFSYAGGRHDVEAMGVLPDGTVLLVTKGRSGGILAYQLPPGTWRRGSSPVATRVDSLPIPADLSTGRVVTDLAIDPTGHKVAIRTYRDVYLTQRNPDGTLTPVGHCDILGREPQGEGITFLADGRLLLVSEKGLFKRGTVHVATCG
ncbi:MAG TPA: hypothetical protein PLL69_03165 [Gemmatimonadales bacterium]|nr:hypothetical protein [Gemmatimonadales bacterium]